MPHHVQFEKAIKKNKKSRLRNRSAKSRMNTAVKKLRASTSKDEAAAMLKDVVSIIDSTAGRGIIKKETASRKISRLSLFVNKLQ